MTTQKWTVLASVCVGKAYGHVPGHSYHDVEATIERSGTRVRCTLLETWGSAQGYDEEHGRHEATGEGRTIDEAVDAAHDAYADVCDSETAGPQYATEASGRAAREAAEAEDRPDDEIARLRERLADLETKTGQS